MSSFVQKKSYSPFVPVLAATAGMIKETKSRDADEAMLDSVRATHADFANNLYLESTVYAVRVPAVFILHFGRVPEWNASNTARQCLECKRGAFTSSLPSP